MYFTCGNKLLQGLGAPVGSIIAGNEDFIIRYVSIKVLSYVLNVNAKKGLNTMYFQVKAQLIRLLDALFHKDMC